MRKSMKQATALTLAAVTALSLTACGGGKADAPGRNPGSRREQG